MSQIKTYEISLPLSEKDYNFLKGYIDNAEVEISDDIREAFYLYKSKSFVADENISFDKNDYSKFIDKLKEKKFIEQFEYGFGSFNTNKFYSKLEKYIREKNILFDRNYDTSEKQAKIIDDLVVKILQNYFIDDNPRWLIRAYIVGRALYFKDKYKPHKATISEIPLSNEAKKIAKEDNLSFEIAKRIEVALDYSNTTIKCLTNEQLKKLRSIIIEEDLIKREPVNKLVEKIYQILPKNDVFLLNVDWHSVIHNELNFIAKKQDWN